MSFELAVENLTSKLEIKSLSPTRLRCTHKSYQVA